LVCIPRASLAFCLQNPVTLYNLCDEHGTLSLRSWGEEVQFLPYRTAHGTGDPDVVLQPGPPAVRGRQDQIPHHCSALGPESAVVPAAGCLCYVPDNQAAKSTVTDQDVGAESQHEVGDLHLSGGGDGQGEVVR